MSVIHFSLGEQAKHAPLLDTRFCNILKIHVCQNILEFKTTSELCGCASNVYPSLCALKTNYVIQLDSDTVTVGNLVDVHTNAQTNTGFVIGSKKWSKPVDVLFLNGIVTQWGSAHVQARAESCFNEIDFFKDGTKYLRGCAGFAGYPKDFATVDQIRKLSSSIAQHVGSDWMKWGSEQTATLCLISKTPNASILPWPEYQNYKFPKTNEPCESMNLIHFIGTNRFDDTQYLQLLKRFCK